MRRIEQTKPSGSTFVSEHTARILHIGGRIYDIKSPEDYNTTRQLLSQGKVTEALSFLRTGKPTIAVKVTERTTYATSYGDGSYHTDHTEEISDDITINTTHVSVSSTGKGSAYASTTSDPDKSARQALARAKDIKPTFFGQIKSIANSIIGKNSYAEDLVGNPRAILNPREETTAEKTQESDNQRSRARHELVKRIREEAELAGYKPEIQSQPIISASAKLSNEFNGRQENGDYYLTHQGDGYGKRTDIHFDQQVPQQTIQDARTALKSGFASGLKDMDEGLDRVQRLRTEGGGIEYYRDGKMVSEDQSHWGKG